VLLDVLHVVLVVVLETVKVELAKVVVMQVQEAPLQTLILHHPLVEEAAVGVLVLEIAREAVILLAQLLVTVDAVEDALGMLAEMIVITHALATVVVALVRIYVMVVHRALCINIKKSKRRFYYK
jgi:hypothetical protein